MIIAANKVEGERLHLHEVEPQEKHVVAVDQVSGQGGGTHLIHQTGGDKGDQGKCMQLGLKRVVSQAVSRVFWRCNYVSF